MSKKTRLILGILLIIALIVGGGYLAMRAYWYFVYKNLFHTVPLFWLS